MAIGERIRYFRMLRGMTQKYLGMQIGYSERTADIRIAQYESGSRGPKADTIHKLAEVLGVSPNALTVPDIDTEIGLMHTLFTLEDRYGLKIDTISDELCIRPDKENGARYQQMFELFYIWEREAEKFRKGEITKEEYDHWRYTFPKAEAERTMDSLYQRHQKKEETE